MDAYAKNNILERGNRIIKMPRKRLDDQVLLVAAIILLGDTQGSEWLNDSLKKFGWKDPITEEEKALILEKAEEIVNRK